MLKCLSEMKKSDENENLTIWNYSGDSKQQTVLNKYRGCITNKENEIICPSLGYSQEYTVFTKAESEDKLRNLEDWNWFYAMEGTKVRLYNYKNKWYLSTHKKICAFQSRWSCNQSFGELFIESLYSIFGTDHTDIFQWFTKQLNSNYIYYFFLRSNHQNRIICHTSDIKESERLVYIGRRYQSSLHFSFLGKTEENVLDYISLPKRVEKSFTTIEEIFDFVENNIDAFKYQGIIGYTSSNHESLKIINSRYKDLIRIRGNNHNLRFRYLEIRKEADKVEKFFMLYPKLVHIFEDYERTINFIVKKITKTYIDRYIQNKYITLPKEEFIILRKCHELCKMKNEKYITQKIVRGLIDNESPVHLYKMITRSKSENSCCEVPYNKSNSLNSLEFIENFYSSENSSEETFVE
jgi:hypothetical protein